MDVEILTVYKKNGTASLQEIERLAQHLHLLNRDLVCLTDHQSLVGITSRPLTQSWPGSWSVLETLRWCGPCLYIDPSLDPAKLDIPRLCNHASLNLFLIGKDFDYRVMSWAKDASGLYRQFETFPHHYIEKLAGPGEFLSKFLLNYKTLMPWPCASFHDVTDK